MSDRILDNTKVFVYGTLKPGEFYYPRYCAGKVVEEKPAIAMGQLYHLPPLGYPAMIPGENQVQGFLLTLANAATLSHLDELEDYEPHRQPEDNEYNRYPIEIYDLMGKSLGMAWAYFMTLEKVQYYQGILISSGCWSGSVVNN
ncbi:MAG: gamma-glutamylcyclotransferase [Cyanobacteriota bacterium]